MLKSELLIYRYSGETIIPKKLPLIERFLCLAQEQIDCFSDCLGKTQGELDAQLLELEGDSPEYRLKRGLAHLLKNHFSQFEVVSPLEPVLLREKVFTVSGQKIPIPEQKSDTLEAIASLLTAELKREVLPSEIERGLYADLQENRILSEFEAPSPETLINRYNLSQVQGIFYRASQIILHAHRNDPGEYKLLFRYLKLFQLMSYIEGDADTGFTITIDGPTSLFKASTRYGLALAKMIPALLHVSKWQLEAKLQLKDNYSNEEKTGYFNLDDSCGLVSHYQKNKTYDSMLEESFAHSWAKLSSEWQLEREVDLVPLPGGVMIPDFRLVHSDGRDFLLEIVGYWRPEYLQKKFYQVRRAEADNLILAVSERLNLAKAGINFQDLPNRVIWFKNKLSAKEVLSVIDNQKN
jgi:predicted nuclease of restriction endonuclease-like RecB superfamily